MQIAPLHPEEDERLKALHDLSILDTPPEPEFDAIAKVAAALCGTSMALISLIDGERQWFKATVGFESDFHETPRAYAFCAHAILGEEEILEVADAAADPRFAGNPLVVGKPHIRFYAGAVLRGQGGMPLGTLCILDQAPKRLSAAQRLTLLDLALVVSKTLAGRRALLEEQRMRELSARAEQVLANSVDAIVIFASDNLITAWNRSAERLFGYPPTKMLGKSILQLIPPECLHEARFFERLHEQPEGLIYETARLHASGELIPVSVSLTPVTGSDGQFIGATAIYRDLRERRLWAERARALMDTTGAGTWEWNVATNSVVLSERWLATLGYEPGELPQPAGYADLMGVVHPGDRERFGDALSDCVAGHTSGFRVECRMVRRDGGIRWILNRGRVVSRTLDGRPEWVFSAQLDITEFKHSELAFHRTERYLQLASALSGAGAWEFDQRTGVLTWSPQTYVVYGVSPDFLPTLENTLAFYAPGDQDWLAQALRRCLTQGEGWDLTLPMTRGDGRQVWVRSVAGMDREGDEFVRVVGAIQDVTHWQVSGPKIP